MLAKLQTVLRQAQRGGYAVGAFNVSNLEQSQAVVRAAVRLHSPVIVNVSAKAIEYAGLETLAAIIRLMAKAAPVPVVLNLDHGRRIALAKRCLRAGFTGIMYDAGRLTYKINLRQTKAVVQAARRYSVGVEGELGQVKYPSDWKKTRKVFLTDPDQAKDFVKETGVIALAVAIGNSHGLPRLHERLDFYRLKAIGQKVRVPLVLHGASGTPAKDIRRAIELGVCKINIDTDLRLAFTGRLRRTLKQQTREFDPRAVLRPATAAVDQVVGQKIILFGSKGRSRR